MPYASKAQRGKFHALEAQGKIAPAVVAEYDAASKGKKLPARVGKTPPSRRKVSEFGSAMNRLRLTK